MPAPAFCRRLLIEYRVLMFPGNSFGAKWSAFVRISLLQPEPQPIEALARLQQFITTLRAEKYA